MRTIERMRPRLGQRSPRQSRHTAPVSRLLLLLALLTPALAGCAQDAQDQWKNLGLPEGITQESRIVETLWQGSWITALAVGAIVWGLIAWSSVAYRRRRHERGFPPQVRYNVPIEALYTTLPFIVIAVLFFFTARDESQMLRLSAQQPANAVNVVNVVGFRWNWNWNYEPGPGNPVPQGVYEIGTPGEPPTLVLPRGEKVRFVLESRDVIHSFWVVPFLFKQDVIPGRSNSFEVTPERTGFFAGKCAEFCGQDHARMLFNVAVVEPDQYRQHLQQLAAEGRTGELPATNGPQEVTDARPRAESDQGGNGG